MSQVSSDTTSTNTKSFLVVNTYIKTAIVMSLVMICLTMIVIMLGKISQQC